MLGRNFFVALTALPFAMPSSATAQWSVVQFGTGTQLEAVHGSLQVGTQDPAGAKVWTGSGSSGVTLGPGTALATDGVQIGGYSGNRAVLWSGPGYTPIDLHPSGMAFSQVTGVDGDWKCGSAAHSFVSYALLWTGSSNTMVSLAAPENSGLVGASDVHAGTVVGQFRSFLTGTYHACVWNGPTLGIDLHPASATESAAESVHGGTQVGWARIGSQQRAALWSGTAASYVDLHPAGATTSVCHGVHGHVQVGEIGIDGWPSASLWKGTAASWVDLHALLPVGTLASVATDVWIDDNGVVYVSGRSSLGGVLWIDSTNAIRTFCRGDGSGTACPCGNDAPGGTDSGCLNSLGVGARLTASGTSRVSNDQLVLLGTQMPATSSVLYFQGVSQDVAGTVFGDGLRCTSGATVRLGSKLNSGGSSIYPDVGEASISARGQVTLPGVTRSYQAWYRNVASFCTPAAFNLTNGVSVSWTP